MARNEQDREDLMREASALTQRIEWQSGEDSERITAGFRRTGGLGVFFDQDPVYQFDADGALRRAFVDGLLFRSQHSTLAELRRVRTPQQTTLLRRDLNAAELADFREAMRNRLADLHSSLTNANPPFRCLRRENCEQDEMTQRVATMLAIVMDRGDSFLSTAIRARR